MGAAGPNAKAASCFFEADFISQTSYIHDINRAWVTKPLGGQDAPRASPSHPPAPALPPQVEFDISLDLAPFMSSPGPIGKGQTMGTQVRRRRPLGWGWNCMGREAPQSLMRIGTYLVPSTCRKPPTLSGGKDSHTSCLRPLSLYNHPLSPVFLPEFPPSPSPHLRTHTRMIADV